MLIEEPCAQIPCLLSGGEMITMLTSSDAVVTVDGRLQVSSGVTHLSLSDIEVGFLCMRNDA